LIETLTATGSTNADLAERLARGEALHEGHWLIADRQSAGRGRQGRAWFDGHGNFMGSTVVHLRPGDPPRPTLALVAGLALHEAVAIRLPPPPQALLKWPNDVMIGPAKLAGILLEGVGEAVVVGVGANLALAPEVPGRETISLAAFGPAPDRDAFALDLAAAFAAGLERWRSYGLAATVARWSAVAHTPGTILSVGEPGETSLEGEFAGLDDAGALLLRLADGTTRTIHAGEVRFAGRA
jgi:BirA family biotin operon repressor/biotin-[acetyl-CoA-carboxylase] ligase